MPDKPQNSVVKFRQISGLIACQAYLLINFVVVKIKDTVSFKIL
jgi:hypothetical protein